MKAIFRKTLIGLLFMVAIASRPPHTIIEQRSIEERVRVHDTDEVKERMSRLLAHDSASDFSLFLLMILSSPLHFRYEDLLRQLAIELNKFEQSCDLLNRKNSERLAIEGALASYIIAFREELYFKNHDTFGTSALFLQRLEIELKNLAIELPQTLLKKVTLISYYLSYEKWTNDEALVYWQNRQLQTSSRRMRHEWEAFFSKFPPLFCETSKHARFAAALF